MPLTPDHLSDPPRRLGRHRRRRNLVAIVVAFVALAASACDIHLIGPPGEAPLRYRDEVFTAVTKTANIPYGSAVNQLGATVDLRLDVYSPTGDTVTTRPAIVWVHGGSFFSGNRASPEIVDEATTMAKKGYVNVSISYRLSTNGCRVVNAECGVAVTDAKHDAQAAVRFLRAHAAEYGVDVNRIAIAGTSAGAITALNVAYGPEDVGTSGNPGYPSTVRAAVSLSGARLLTTPNPGEAPALLFHGSADVIVPYSLATNTVAAAQSAGLQIYLTTWEGEGHVPYVAHRTEIIDQTTNFLYWELDAGSASR